MVTSPRVYLEPCRSTAGASLTRRVILSTHRRTSRGGALKCMAAHSSGTHVTQQGLLRPDRGRSVQMQLRSRAKTKSLPRANIFPCLYHLFRESFFSSSRTGTIRFHRNGADPFPETGVLAPWSPFSGKCVRDRQTLAAPQIFRESQYAQGAPGYAAASRCISMAVDKGVDAHFHPTDCID